MISLIIFLVSAVILLLISIKQLLKGREVFDENNKFFGLLNCMLGIFCLTLLVVSLYAGRSIKQQPELLEEKAKIEYVLNNNPTVADFNAAEEYNKKVENGNNYWYRFNIEDRSDYLIDIEKYYKGEK